jgi:hypothetical protein
MTTTTSTISIADLIHLLDKETQDALASRLHKVLDGTETPQQLLFEFIDAGIESLEEETSFDTDAEVATRLLSAIENPESSVNK